MGFGSAFRNITLYRSQGLQSTTSEALYKFCRDRLPLPCPKVVSFFVQYMTRLYTTSSGPIPRFVHTFTKSTTQCDRKSQNRTTKKCTGLWNMTLYRPLWSTTFDYSTRIELYPWKHRPGRLSSTCRFPQLLRTIEKMADRKGLSLRGLLPTSVESFVEGDAEADFN